MTTIPTAMITATTTATPTAAIRPRPTCYTSTNPFEQSFPVAELADIDEVFEVDELGNAIQFVGFTLGDLDPCPKGFLSGLWLDDPDTEDGSGFFRGRWVSVHGRGMGHMMGRYGYNEDGEPVFARRAGRLTRLGKWIRRHKAAAVAAGSPRSSLMPSRPPAGTPPTRRHRTAPRIASRG